MVLRSRRAPEPGRGAHDGYRLAVEGLIGRARCPVDRVLEHARHGIIVLRGGEEERIRGGDRLAEALHRRRKTGLAHIFVVKRDRGYVGNGQRHTVGQELRRGTQGGAIKGAFAQTAAHAQHFHYTLIGHGPALASWKCR